LFISAEKLKVFLKGSDNFEYNLSGAPQMSLILSLIFTFTFFSYASADDKKFEEIQTKIQKNLEKYCSERVAQACEMKKALDSQTGMPPVDMNFGKADNAALQEQFKKMDACNGDLGCMKKISDEATAKGIAEADTKCKNGSKEACFFKEHMQLLNEMQNNL
jgi:hypothetical protein